MHQGVGLADGLQQGVALAAAVADARHVHKVDGGGRILFGMIVLRQPVQPLVGDLGRAQVGLGRCVGVAAGLRARPGKRVEQSALAHVGQAYDT